MNKICKHCGNEMIDGSQYCQNCGNKSEEDQCRKCGKMIPADASFCIYCGIEVTPKTDSEPQEELDELAVASETPPLPQKTKAQGGTRAIKFAVECIGLFILILLVWHLWYVPHYIPNMIWEENLYEETIDQLHSELGGLTPDASIKISGDQTLGKKQITSCERIDLRQIEDSFAQILIASSGLDLDKKTYRYQLSVDWSVFDNETNDVLGYITTETMVVAQPRYFSFECTYINQTEIQYGEELMEYRLQQEQQALSDMVQLNDWYLSEDYAGNKIICIQHTFTNTTDAEAIPATSFSVDAFQNGTLLSYLYTYSEPKIQGVPPGSSVELLSEYRLHDFETPVEVVVGEYWSMDEDSATFTATADIASSYLYNTPSAFSGEHSNANISEENLSTAEPDLVEKEPQASSSAIGTWYATNLDPVNGFSEGIYDENGRFQMHGIELKIVEIDGENYAYLLYWHPFDYGEIVCRKDNDALLPIVSLDATTRQIIYDVTDPSQEDPSPVGTGVLTLTTNPEGKVFIEIQEGDYALCNRMPLSPVDEWLGGQYAYYDEAASFSQMRADTESISALQCERDLWSLFYGRWSTESSIYDLYSGSVYIVSYQENFYRNTEYTVNFYYQNDTTTLHQAVFSDVYYDGMQKEMVVDGIVWTSIY